MPAHKNIRLLAIHNFFTDFVPFAPIAIIYFSQVSGSYALGMSVFAISYIAAALFEVPTGVISDYMGRRKTIIWGSVFSLLCVFFYALGTSYWILVVGSLFFGISHALYSGNNDALLHESLAETGREHTYHEYMGKTYALFQVGLGLAAIIGSIIANWSFAWVMWISLIPKFGSLIISFSIKEPSAALRPTTNIYAHLREALRCFWINAKLRHLSLASILRFSLGETGYFFRNAYVATLWPVWALGIVGVIAHTGAAISFYLSGRLINRFRHIRVLAAETVINRVINFTALALNGPISPALMATSSWMFGVGSVAINSLMQKEFTQKERATMSSLNALAGSVAFGVFSVSLGALADYSGELTALWVNHVLLLLPLIFYRKLAA